MFYIYQSPPGQKMPESIIGGSNGMLRDKKRRRIIYICLFILVIIILAFILRNLMVTTSVKQNFSSPTKETHKVVEDVLLTPIKSEIAVLNPTSTVQTIQAITLLPSPMITVDEQTHQAQQLTLEEPIGS
ncbi:MAG: hypothetical protein P1P73_02265 [Brevefilum sp.]|nr:hypothetical protein [Brevefilum sp.]